MIDKTKSFTGVFIVEVVQTDTKKVLFEETYEQLFPPSYWDHCDWFLEDHIKTIVMTQYMRRKKFESRVRQMLDCFWHVDVVLVERKQ